MRAILLLTVALIPAAVRADCAGETLISCDTGAGWLEVCVEPGAAKGAGAFTYAFGAKGAPETRLREEMAAGTATPWPGIGMTIWEEVGFRDGDLVHVAYLAVDREDDAEMRAGAAVSRGAEPLSMHVCLPGPDAVIAPAFTIEDAMMAAGYCRDLERREWRRGGCG